MAYRGVGRHVLQADGDVRGVQPMDGLSPPVGMARVRADCTARRARTPSATLWPDFSRERSSMITVPFFREG